jgi:hypothetical protein
MHTTHADEICWKGGNMLKMGETIRQHSRTGKAGMAERQWGSGGSSSIKKALSPAAKELQNALSEGIRSKPLIPC